MLDKAFKITPVLEQGPCLAERVSNLTNIKSGDLLEIEGKVQRVHIIKIKDYKDLANPTYEITVLSKDKEVISKKTYDSPVSWLQYGHLHYFISPHIPKNKRCFRDITKKDREYAELDKFLKQYEPQENTNTKNRKLNMFIRLFKKSA